MFSLKDNIETWKDNLCSKEDINSSDIEELESHLIEEVDNLKTSGLTEEEAFIIAKHRLGDNSLIMEEYSKVSYNEVLMKKTSYLILGYFLITLINQIIQILNLLFIGIAGEIFTNYTYLPLKLEYVRIIFTITTVISILIIVFLFKNMNILEKLNLLVNRLYLKSRIFTSIILLAGIIVSYIGLSYLQFLAVDNTSHIYLNTTNEIFTYSMYSSYGFILILLGILVYSFIKLKSKTTSHILINK